MSRLTKGLAASMSPGWTLAATHTNADRPMLRVMPFLVLSGGCMTDKDLYTEERV